MSTFKFKHFSISQENTTMKVGTDAMILGALIGVGNKRKGLEIGLGTGVIALMLAQRNQELTIDGVEIDESASKEAKLNFKVSPWSDRLCAFQEDVLEFDSGEKYDLIFSNPPYYQDSLPNTDERKARARHEEFLPVEKMVEKVASLLDDSGDFWVIIPIETVDNWILKCKQFGLNRVHQINMVGKEGGNLKRAVVNFSRASRNVETSEITIRNSDNTYTDEYISLTKEYHATDLNAKRD